MFTGLVEEVGRVTSLRASEGAGDAHLGLAAGVVREGTHVGDSILVNGACLTVDEIEADALVFYTMPETLRRTALGDLTVGSPVNLERAMAAGGRLGGHIVQGHVDGVGEVLDVRAEDDAEIWTFGAPASVLRYAVEKGSVCVDGISLTVVSVGEDRFTVSILPHTRSHTNLGELGVGSHVNLEADVVGKYVERLMQPWNARNISIPEGERDAV
jgi:riboflavin synthase